MSLVYCEDEKLISRTHNCLRGGTPGNWSFQPTNIVTGHTLVRMTLAYGRYQTCMIRPPLLLRDREVFKQNAAVIRVESTFDQEVNKSDCMQY